MLSRKKKYLQIALNSTPEEGEDIRLHVLNVKTAYSLLNQGKINNGSTIIALQWLQHNEQIVRDVFLKKSE